MVSACSLRPCFGRKSSNLIRHCKHREKSSLTTSSSQLFEDHIYQRARDNAINFDSNYNYKHDPNTIHPSVRLFQSPMKPYKISTGSKEGLASVPEYINTPPYAKNGNVPPSPNYIILQDEDGIDKIRSSARKARKILDKACELAKVNE